MDQRAWVKRISYDMTRVAARMAGVVAFRIRCAGRDQLPEEGGALVCANHQSFLDPVLIGLAADRRLNYLARKSLFRSQPFRGLIQWYDAIPIERDGLGLAGVKETLRRLKRGELVLLFPEGTRSHDGTVGPLKPGFTTLARRAKVPLVPVALDGAYQVWPRTQPFPWPGPISIQFGAPISAPDVAAMDDAELLERLRTELLKCYTSARRCRGS